MHVGTYLASVPVSGKTPKELFDLWAESDQLMKLGNWVVKNYTNFKYAKINDKEQEKKQIFLIALWKTVNRHKETEGNHFVNSLCRHISWELNAYLHRFRKINTDKIKEAQRLGFIRTTVKQPDDLSEMFSGDDLKLMRLYFEYRATLEEIGRVYGISKEAARLRINKVMGRANIECI